MSTRRLAAAYRAGWNASGKLDGPDMDTAEDRYARSHDAAQQDAWAAGWLDYASDLDYGHTQPSQCLLLRRTYRPPSNNITRLEPARPGMTRRLVGALVAVVLAASIAAAGPVAVAGTAVAVTPACNAYEAALARLAVQHGDTLRLACLPGLPV